MNRCATYFNLHKRCFSISVGGRVRAHSHSVTLKNCTFVVRPAGRTRVLRENHKCVHAFVVGAVTDEEPEGLARSFTYNPYRSDKFYFKETGKPVSKADYVRLEVVDGRPVCYAYGAK